jgi:dTDP-glucose 4,6-dehydratase
LPGPRINATAAWPEALPPPENSRYDRRDAALFISSRKAMILVTGGAGFIGSNFIIDWLAEMDEANVNLDKLTYAGHTGNFRHLASDHRHVFVRGDIGDRALVSGLLKEYRPRAVINFAAETHVDRSIHSPDAFLTTNVAGIFDLLESVRSYWCGLEPNARRDFRFVHVSTDEVYGTLAPDAPPAKETNGYQPNSPYAASKAASDHFVRAWHHTYGLPTLTTNCSNNYGPRQFPEKLIPLMIVNALAGRKLPLYGDGLQRRDWLYVSDHCAAIRRILESGRPGETYNIGGRNEMTNMAVVRMICETLDALKPRADGNSYASQIAHVEDRPGHDRRYALDAAKLIRELGWEPLESPMSGMQKTVAWYLENRDWLESVESGAYKAWIEKQYGRNGECSPNGK